MKICVDVGPALQGRAGLGRYAVELLAALLRVAPQHEYITFHNAEAARSALPPALDRLPKRGTRLSNIPWRLSTLPAYGLNLPQDRLVPGVDLFHATDQLLPRLKHTHSVFTIYDAAFRLYPETHTRQNRWFLNLMVPRFLRAAGRIIAISECTKQDTVRLYGIAPDNIHVIPLGVHPRFRPIQSPDALAAARGRYGLPARYVLSVGTIEPRKNLTLLLEAYQALLAGDPELGLVIVGQKGWLYERFFRRLAELGLEGRVIFPGFVPGEDLPALYSAAACFAYPSLYEGFGLPVLEAMAGGTPVVCSNSSSLPEVAGDAALLLEPQDVEGWVVALRRILTDATLRVEMREKGRRQAARFTWDETARRTAAVYDEAVR